MSTRKNQPEAPAAEFNPCLVRVLCGGFTVSISTNSPGHIVSTPDGTVFGLLDHEQRRALVEALTIVDSIEAQVRARA